MKIDINFTHSITVSGFVFSWIEFEFVMEMILLHGAGLWGACAHDFCLKASYYLDRALTSSRMISMNLVFHSVCIKSNM